MSQAAKISEVIERLNRSLFVTLAVVRKLVVLPQRRWFHAGLSLLFIFWGTVSFAHNLPFFLHLNLGKVAREYGRFAVAEELYRLALADSAYFHNPAWRQVRALSALGELYFDECRYERSACAYESVLDLRQQAKLSVSDQCETMLHLGVAYRKLGRLEQAQHLLGQGLRLGGACPGAMRLRCQLQLALGQVLAAQKKDVEAEECFGQAVRFFIGEKERGARYARACLSGQIDCLRRRSQTVRAKELEVELEKIHLPAPRYSWLEYEQFCYAISNRILTSSLRELLEPNLELERQVSPSALHAIKRSASQLAAPAPACLIIEYVEMVGPDKNGLLSASVLANRYMNGGAVKHYYLRYKVGFGLKTAEPILSRFAMLGMASEHAFSQVAPEAEHGPNLSQDHN